MKKSPAPPLRIPPKKIDSDFQMFKNYFIHTNQLTLWPSEEKLTENLEQNHLTKSKKPTSFHEVE